MEFQLLVNRLKISGLIRAQVLSAIFALTFFCAVPLRALSVIPPTFPELVSLATEIVRVEVLEVSSRFDNPAGTGSIHTYVRCRVLRSLKGSNSETMTLRLLGGQVGEILMDIPDMPTFTTGEKYILFVAQNGRAFCPLVAASHGAYFVVTDDTAAGTERVLRYNHDPLLSVASVVQPMADHVQGNTTRSALISSLSVADFETAILREIANAK